MKTVIAILFFPVLLSMGCSNPETPAGFEGYVRQDAYIGVARFYDVQAGPSSTGLGWLLSAANVDFRWKTYNEDFHVMSSDNLNLNFHAHLIIKPRNGTIKEIVEVYGGEEWYDRSLKEPFRNAVYEAVAGYKALEAKDKREQIGHAVHDKFNAFIYGKPFEVQGIVIGTINLPPSVATAQEKKIEKETELSRKFFEIEIAKKEAEVRVEEAKGIAESQKIINVTLTPNYLQHEAIKAQEKMAMSPNHTTIYIPSGANGIPLVNTIDPSK